jgi:hypothetical protein
MAGQSNDSDDASGIFWPGYVDAISNLVLNLLFLVMILCLAIFVMSQSTKTPSGAQSSVPREIRHEEARPDLGTRLSSGGKTDVVQKRAEIEVRPSPEGKQAGAVQIKSPTISDQGVYLEVRYLDEALELTETSQQALRQQLQPLLQQGFTQWELVVVTDTAFATMRRSALLRLLRVREALNAPELQGIKSNTRIDSGGTPVTTTVVRLYGRRAEPSAQLPTQPVTAPSAPSLAQPSAR